MCLMQDSRELSTLCPTAAAITKIETTYRTRPVCAARKLISWAHAQIQEMWLDRRLVARDLRFETLPRDLLIIPCTRALRAAAHHFQDPAEGLVCLLIAFHAKCNIIPILYNERQIVSVYHYRSVPCMSADYMEMEVSVCSTFFNEWAYVPPAGFAMARHAPMGSMVS